MVQATCWARECHAKLTSKCTGYLQTNGGSKQFHCCKGSLQQEADHKTSQADLIDHQRPATELSHQTSISLLGQSLLQRNSYRRTPVKKLEKDLHCKAVGESKWGNYSCDLPENCSFHWWWFTDQPRQKGRQKSRVVMGAVLKCSLYFYQCVNYFFLLY